MGKMILKISNESADHRPSTSIYKEKIDDVRDLTEGDRWQTAEIIAEISVDSAKTNLSKSFELTKASVVVYQNCCTSISSRHGNFKQMRPKSRRFFGANCNWR